MRQVVAGGLSLALFGAAFVTSGALSMSVEPRPAAALSGAGWAPLISNCITDASEASYDAECIETLWKSSYDAGDLLEFNKAMHEQQLRAPLLGATCHEAGHRAGQYAYSQRPDAAWLLKAGAVDEFSCNNGFLHGVLDALATSDPSPSEVSAAYRTCEELENPAHQQCTDGSGHAAWQMTHDPVAAMELCTVYEAEPDMETCAGGVVMQTFRPDTDGSRGAVHSWATARSSMGKMCRALAEAEMPKAILTGCVSASGNMFSGAAIQVTYELAQQRAGQPVAYSDASVLLGRAGEDVPAWTTEDAAKLWNDALDMCQEFTPRSELGGVDGPAECRRHVAGAIAWASRDTALLDSLCARLPADLQETCRFSEVG